ncbi:hypothetical protein ACWGJ2_03840 [Streptomyces sp. NPDC054796]
MNSAPHLRLEDRPEFERALDEALRHAHRRPDTAAIGQRLNAEQLRTMALSAATAIAACAAVEYEHFVRLREEMRHLANLPASAAPQQRGAAKSDGGSAEGGPGRAGEAEGGVGLAGAVGEGLVETAGAGLAAMLSVLAPVLAGTAALIFLLLGYLLHMVTPEPAVAEPMRDIGLVFAVLAAAGAVVAMTALWLTALRNGSSSIRAKEEAAGPGAALADEVDRARGLWREALLERGILPFLREALADPQGSGQAPAAYVRDDLATGQSGQSGSQEPEPQQRTPRLGYSHPDFSSRTSSEAKSGEKSVRPRYTSPDFSSPDYGGPDHQPD